MEIKKLHLFLFISFLVAGSLWRPLFAQKKLSLKEAIQMGVDNYGTVKAKKEYAAASKAGIALARRVPFAGFQFPV